MEVLPENFADFISPTGPKGALSPPMEIFDDRDMKAQDAVLKLYNSGIEISKIQKCFSIGSLCHECDMSGRRSIRLRDEMEEINYKQTRGHTVLRR